MTFNPKQPNKVFLLDTDKQPLNPITPRQARKLLEKGKAAVLRQYPFTLILKTSVESPLLYDLVLKIDPGSKHTGLAILSGDVVIWVAQIEHRGGLIKKSLKSRSDSRRGRRNRNTRYRQPRFNNRKRSEGWLAPSLLHRVQNIDTWVNRLVKSCPIKEVWIEKVKFDTQKMMNPEVSGVDYQQGELQGYEVREYLLEKWGRECAYCGKRDVPLQVEHIIPKAKGGSNRVSNLTLACEKCNQKKGTDPIEKFLKKKPALLKKIKAKTKQSLKDTAAVNSTKNKLVQVISDKLPVITDTGAKTKYNRTRLNLPKDHHIDAACVGDVGNITFYATQPLMIKSTGHGDRQFTKVDKYGFPRNKAKDMVRPTYFGYKTGDLVVSVVTGGKKIGVHRGRVAVRKTGSFDVKTKSGTVTGLGYRTFDMIQASDGYNYSFE